MDFMFGHTPCAILTKVEFGKHVADAYMIEDSGNILRQIGNQAGLAIQFSAETAEVAVERAARHLTDCTTAPQRGS